MFVYIDGAYQCNRNRSNLRVPAEGTKRRRTEVDFRVRQKEETWVGGDGGIGDRFVGREWRFEKLGTDGEEGGEAPPWRDVCGGD